MEKEYLIATVDGFLSAIAPDGHGNLKSIASNNPIRTDIPQLPPVEQSVEQLAQAYIESEMAYQIQPEYVQKGVIRDFTAGYKAAQPKQYTEEDIIKLFELFLKKGYEINVMGNGFLYNTYCHASVKETVHSLLQSLRPVPKAVVLEMEKQWLVDMKWVNSTGIDWNDDANGKADDIAFPHRLVPKVDSNNRVILVKWIY